MKKETVVLVIGIVIVGLVIWIAFSSQRGNQAGQEAVGPVAGAPVTDPGRIALLQDVVKKTPDNRSAWVQLGNLYYDSGQPAEAVQAYGKALDLDPNDPNVLTDQGVMFRQLGQYDQALDNFRKAHQIDPNHIQSLYNMGVVYRFDLKDFPKAQEVWEEYLQLNPVGPGADQVRQELERMKQTPAFPNQMQ